jgi:hypothetical protein
MYSLKCPACEAHTNKKLTFSQYDSMKSGEEILPCTNCDKGGMLEFVFSPGDVGFVLRDGVHGGWVSKASRENKYRGKRRIDMTRREKDHVFKNKLIPNYKGDEASSWKDVQDEVRTKQGEASAATYDPLVAKEQRASS